VTSSHGSPPRVRGALIGAVVAAIALTSAPVGAQPAVAPAPLHPPPQLVEPVVPPAPGWPEPPAATATAYVLLDVETGQVLAERASDVRRPVASTVKVLTALTVLRRADPDDVVEIGEEVAAVGGAGVGLDPGERWTVRQLLDGLVVRSGNDAAVALAVHVGGTVEDFVSLMREDAEALGLDGLILASPSGLEDANRLSARDLAVVTRAALADPAFRRIAASAEVTLPGLGPQPSRNELLGVYPGANGVKTGFTEAAGYSLVASAEREGRQLVAVVLDSRDADARFDDAARLLDHGFDAFTRREIELEARVREAGRWTDLRAGPLVLLVPRAEPEGLRIDPLATPEVAALPDELTLAYEGEPLARLDVERSTSSRPPADGGAAVGRFLVDRIYAGLRVAAIGAEAGA
jgi:D-alanyl-D-alanine carboxypeptidase (penicillin-binding protein 5/6)